MYTQFKRNIKKKYQFPNNLFSNFPNENYSTIKVIVLIRVSQLLPRFEVFQDGGTRVYRL